MRASYIMLPLPLSLGRRIVLPFLLHFVLLANTPLATCRGSHQFGRDSTTNIGVRSVSQYPDSIRPFLGVKSRSVVRTEGQPLTTADGSSQCPPYGDRVSVVSTQLQRTCFHVQGTPSPSARISRLCSHTCPLLSARGGVNRTRSFDDGCAQKTHFRFIIISSPLRPTGIIRTAAQIEYMPNSSSHKVI